MTSRSLNRIFVFLTLAALLLPGALLAQSTTNGAISGTVTDASGAVLANVAVNLKSIEKGFTQKTSTNAQGFYEFPLLEPGTYNVTIAVTISKLPAQPRQ